MQKFSALVCVAAFALAIHAQIISSSIVGLITDSTGAFVTDAEVTVTNEGTGISFRTTSGSSGTYSAPTLQPGVYTVAVSRPGFQTSRRTGVQLLASHSVRVNLQLEVGQVQQNIVVQAEAALIKTETPTIGGTLTNYQIKELPLAQQSIDRLLALAPGAQRSGAWPQAGGATHWGSTNFTINGSQANDPGNGSGAYAYNFGLISLPPVQSLQEFKVESYNTNAEYRNVSTVTMVTKAGTNALHGDVYEYVQNKALNANTFVNNANRQRRQPFIRNQFGFNVAGPIVKNKAFFFGDYSGLRNRTYGGVQNTFPSMAMREGDFSAQPIVLYDPWAGIPFPGNRIPAARITSQAKAMLAYMPAPNAPVNQAGLPSGGINFYDTVRAAQTVNAADLRIDYMPAANDQLYFVYTRNIGDPMGVNLGYPATYGNASNYGYKTFGYSLTHNHTFSPTTINDFRFSYFDHPNIRSGMNADFDVRKLFPQVQAVNGGLPGVDLAGYTRLGDAGLGLWAHNFSWDFGDNITHVRGKHTYKAGVSISTYKSNQPGLGGLPGFNFNGQFTGNQGWPGQPKSQGNSIADFLLGAARSSSDTLPPKLDTVYHGWNYEFYFQDTWQAAPRLTLYYGIRYSYQTPWQWQNGYSTTWDPTTNKLVLPQNSDTPTLPPYAASAAMFAAYPFTTTQALGWPERYVIPDKNNWGPRFGIAFRPFSDNRTVIRAGYGVYYNFNPCFVGQRNEGSNPPWAGMMVRQSYNSQLSGNITKPFVPDITFDNPFPASLQAVAGVAANPGIFYLQRDFKIAAAQQWSLTLERQFGSDWAGRLTYAGSQTHHIQWYASDFNIPMVQTPGVTTQNQRPYKPWGSITSARSGASQNFNQFQVEATRRTRNGFTFQLQYAWTRSLDNVEDSGGPQNPNYPGLDYGNSAGIRTHTLVFHWVYELPFGRGKHFLGSTNAAVDAVLGGWQVSGITNYSSGSPFHVSFGVPTTYVGWWGGRADRVAESNAYLKKSDSHDIISGIPYLDAAAFAPPQPWTWGNMARNSLWGPGSSNWDISLAKTFAIAERVRAQVRADAFNAFNHFNLGNPNTSLPNLRDGGTANPNFGKILSGSGNRTMQLGLRVSF